MKGAFKIGDPIDRRGECGLPCLFITPGCTWPPPDKDTGPVSCFSFQLPLLIIGFPLPPRGSTLLDYRQFSPIQVLSIGTNKVRSFRAKLHVFQTKFVAYIARYVELLPRLQKPMDGEMGSDKQSEWQKGQWSLVTYTGFYQVAVHQMLMMSIVTIYRTELRLNYWARVDGNGETGKMQVWSACTDGQRGSDKVKLKRNVQTSWRGRLQGMVIAAKFRAFIWNALF